MGFDCSFDIPELSRFRINVYVTKNGVGTAFRVIPSDIPSSDDIELTQTIIDFTKLPQGLVLVTGPTGSRKTTTLACLINIIKLCTRRTHINN